MASASVRPSSISASRLAVSNIGQFLCASGMISASGEAAASDGLLASRGPAAVALRLLLGFWRTRCFDRGARLRDGFERRDAAGAALALRGLERRKAAGEPPVLGGDAGDQRRLFAIVLFNLAQAHLLADIFRIEIPHVRPVHRAVARRRAAAIEVLARGDLAVLGEQHDGEPPVRPDPHADRRHLPKYGKLLTGIRDE